VKIQNATPHIQVLGDLVLEPGGVGVVPQEFWENATVERMIEKAKFMLISGEAAELSDVAEEEHGEAANGNGDNIEALLEKWSSIPVKKCKELVATSTQRALLARMLPFEKRKTVKAAIEARLTELEEDIV